MKIKLITLETIGNKSLEVDDKVSKLLSQNRELRN